MPLIAEDKTELERLAKTDPTVKKMDLVAISEKEVFVRKADLVSSATHTQ